MDKYLVVHDVDKYDKYNGDVNIQVGIYDKQNPQPHDSQIPKVITPDTPSDSPIPDRNGGDSKDEEGAGGNAGLVVVMLLLIFGGIGAFVYFYGKECLEKM